jgi:hypothetical protein
MDGDAEGRLSAEFVTRVVRAYKIPRTKVLKSGDLDDLHTPAVYFLLGDDDTGKSRSTSSVTSTRSPTALTAASCSLCCLTICWPLSRLLRPLGWSGWWDNRKDE